MTTTDSDEVIDDLLVLARNHLAGDREAAAVELLEAYLARRPNHGEGWWNYGKALRILGRKHEAQKALLTAIRLTDQHKGAVAVQLGKLYEERGNRSRADRWFARAVVAPDLAECDWVLILRGANLAASENLDEAVGCFREAICKHDANEDEAYLNLGNVFRAQRNYVAAEDAFRKALELTPDYGEAISALASLDGVRDVLTLIIPSLDHSTDEA